MSRDTFKEFVEKYRCRLCKTPMSMDNFGGLDDNHMIYCRECSRGWEFNTDTQTVTPQ